VRENRAGVIMAVNHFWHPCPGALDRDLPSSSREFATFSSRVDQQPLPSFEGAPFHRTRGAVLGPRQVCGTNIASSRFWLLVLQVRPFSGPEGTPRLKPNA